MVHEVYRVAGNSVDNDVGQSNNDQLARARNASLAPSQWVVVQRIRGIEDRFRHRTCGGRIVLSDIANDSLKVPRQRRCPSNLQECFQPSNSRSTAAQTSDLETKSPRSASARPARTAS